MDTGNLMIDAQTAFARQRRRRRRARAAGWLLRRSSAATCLLRLDQEVGSAAASRRLLGVHPIPLTSVVGTVEASKARAFDRGFRPSQASRRHWERLWVAARRGASLPPISVYRVGQQHFVADGHHRVSVANALGMTAIDAEVTELASSSSGPAPRTG
jgi:hypothetical protein